MVLSVDVGEQREHVQAFAEEHNLTFPNLLDQSGSVAQTYRVRNIPATFFIDRDGVILARHIGPLGESVIGTYWGQDCD